MDQKQQYEHEWDRDYKAKINEVNIKSSKIDRKIIGDKILHQSLIWKSYFVTLT